MKVKISQANIDRARELAHAPSPYSARCPLALALADLGLRTPRVCLTWAEWGPPGERTMARLGRDASRFVTAWDRDGSVKPTEVELVFFLRGRDAWSCRRSTTESGSTC